MLDAVRASTSQVVVTDALPVVLLESSDNRKSFIIHNSVGCVYVRYGRFDASNTEYTFRLPSSSTLEVDNFRGRVTAIKESGQSALLITEMF